MSYSFPQGLLVLKKREQNRPKKERRDGKKRKIRREEMRNRKSASLKWHSLPASVYCPFCLCSHLSNFFFLFNMYLNVSSQRFLLTAFLFVCFLLPCYFFCLFRLLIYLCHYAGVWTAAVAFWSRQRRQQNQTCVFFFSFLENSPLEAKQCSLTYRAWPSFMLTC